MCLQNMYAILIPILLVRSKVNWQLRDLGHMGKLAAWSILNDDWGWADRMLHRDTTVFADSVELNGLT